MRIPGPTPSYPLGTLGDFRGKNPWEVCADYGNKYGGMTLIWMGGKPTLVLNDPDLIGEVLITKFDDEKAVQDAKQNPDSNRNDLLSVFLRQGTEIPDLQIVDFLSEFHTASSEGVQSEK